MRKEEEPEVASLRGECTVTPVRIFAGAHFDFREDQNGSSFDFVWDWLLKTSPG